MKYKYGDIKFYIDDCIKYNDNNIDCISLSKKIFGDICEDVCESHFEIFDKFEYNGYKFILEEYHKYDPYMIIYLKGMNAGFGYQVFSEDERIIKDIIE